MRRMTNQDASRAAPLAEAGRHFLLRPDITFLNRGSFGACPAPVFETYQRWQRELESEPVEFLGRRIRSLLEEARAPLAAYLGCTSDPRFLRCVPDELPYFKNEAAWCGVWRATDAIFRSPKPQVAASIPIPPTL
jgi:hypothetical protein